jgi:hypothetical protein
MRFWYREQVERLATSALSNKLCRPRPSSISQTLR